MQINQHFAELAESYLFSTVGSRAAAYAAAHPEQKVIRMGIGDVTLPLAGPVIDALHAAVDEMAHKETFRGYGPDGGYGFLRQAIAGYYARHGVTLSPEEIFVSDGAKSDIANILDLFGPDNTVLVPDPVYPVYFDTNVMAGRRILLAPATEQNGFLPMPAPGLHADIVYLCSPNNPTGAAYTRAQLAEWVAWANREDAVILYDAAYECFIQDEGLARSIFEVEGAKNCAIEFCSFSKMAGFTGTRCGYTVVPAGLTRGGMKLAPMWLRRQTTKYNGTPYIVQKAAAAVFTPEGMAAIQQNLDYYRKNAKVLAGALAAAGVPYYGGTNSPYLWMKCPGGMGSWEFFDWLLQHAQVVGTPGEGFGECGKGWFRLTAFGGAEETAEAAARMQAALAAFAG